MGFSVYLRSYLHRLSHGGKTTICFYLFLKTVFGRLTNPVELAAQGRRTLAVASLHAGAPVPLHSYALAVFCCCVYLFRTDVPWKS